MPTGFNKLDQLSADLRFPDRPDYEMLLDTFDAPHNMGGMYGVRVRSYFEGRTSGAYRFAVSCDDFCSLSLGDDIESTKRIVNADDWVRVFDWKR